MSNRKTFNRFAAGSCAVASAFLCSWTLDIGIVSAIPLFYMFSLLGALAMTWGALESMRMAPPSRAEAAGFLFLAWAAATTIWSRAPVESLYQLNSYIGCFVSFILIYRVSADPRWWRFIGWAYIAGCAVASCIVAAKGFTFVSSGIGESRASIGNLNANFVAYSVATSIPVLLGLVTTKRYSLLVKFAAFAYIVTAVSAVLFTGSRGALVAIAASLMVFFALRARRNFLASVFGVGLAILAMFMLSEYLPDEVRTRLDIFALALSQGGSSVDLTGREDLWPIALDVFMDNPIAGVGIGAFPSVNPLGMAAHNAVLSVAAETGAIGFILYFSIIGLIFRRVLFYSKSPSIRLAGFTLLLTWAAIAMTGAWEGSPVAWLVFGWMLAASKQAPELVEVTSKRKRRWTAARARNVPSRA